MRTLLLTALLMAAAGLASCGGMEPGNVSLKFAWSEPPAEAVWVWVRVEERLELHKAGPILASAGPAEYIAGQPLELDLLQVPNGSDRVVVVEVRESDNPLVPVLYYGLSQPFSVSAGKTTEVEVALDIKAPDTAQYSAQVSLRFEGTEPEAVNLAQAQAATVATASVGAAAIVLANDASFSANLTTLSLDSSDKATCVEEVETVEGVEVAWQKCELEGWDLRAGLPDLGDGVYSVFAKFVDSQGYESQVYSASVVLDRQAPVLLAASISPAVAHAGQVVTITASFHEELAEDDNGPSLVVEPAVEFAPEFGAAQRMGDSNSWQWTAEVETLDQEDQNVYTFEVEVSDALGNDAELTPLLDLDSNPLELRIDALPPVLIDPDEIVFSDDLFGIDGAPDSGENLLAFDFVFEERTPDLSSDDECSSCPEVLIGGAPVGKVTRVESLDDAAAARYGFHFQLTIAPEEWGDVEADLPVRIRWQDLGGNIADSKLERAVRFDFIRPSSVECSLVPAMAGAQDEMVLALTSSETLAEPPVLALEDGNPDLFNASPEVSGEGLVYTWTQTAEGLAEEHFEVGASLVDVAGNESDGQACTLQGTVDLTAPELVDSPSSVSPARFGIESPDQPEDNLMAFDFVVKERNSSVDDGSCQGACPVVMLNGIPAGEVLRKPKLDVANQAHLGFRYEYQVAADEWGKIDQTMVISVAWEDLAGNPLQETLTPDVRFDFIPPSALDCSLDPAIAGGQDLVSYSVTASEQLLLAPSLSEAAPPLLAQAVPSISGAGQTYTWHAPAADVAEGEYALESSLTDLAGNASMGGVCPETLTVDTTAPSLFEAPTPFSKTLFGIEDPDAPEENTLTFEFRIVEDLPPAVANVEGECTGLCPQVLIDSVIMGNVVRLPLLDDPDLEILGFAFQYFVQTDDWSELDKLLPLRVHWQDLAGNLLDVPLQELVRFDFIRPIALDCSLAPELAGAEDSLSFGITVSENLLNAPQLAFEPGLPGLFEEEPLASGTGNTYTWTTSAAALEGGDFSVGAMLTDLAGNGSEGAVCLSDGAVDAEAPVLMETSPEDLSGLIFGIEDQESPEDNLLVLDAVFVDAKPAQHVLQDGLCIAGCPMLLLDGTPRGSVELWPELDDPVQNALGFRFKYLVTADDWGEVDKQMTLSLAWTDLAGNKTDTTLPTGPRFDFIRPHAMDCELNPQMAGESDHASFTVTASEALAQPPELTVQGPEFLFELPPEVGAGGLAYTWSQPAALFADGDYTVEAQMEDLAGNSSNGPVCQLAGTIDATAPVLMTETALEYNRTRFGIETAESPEDNLFTFEFVLREAGSATADDQECDANCPTVRLDGIGLGTVQREPNLDSPDNGQFGFRYSYLVQAADWGPLEKELEVSVAWQDEAGNPMEEDLPDTVHFDFVRPQASACNLIPDVANATSTISYAVTASEQLSGAPSLQHDCQGGGLFGTPPADSDGSMTWTWVQLAADVQDQECLVASLLQDLAGNASDEAVCPLPLTIDTTPPHLVAATISTIPVVLDGEDQPMLAVGPGDTLRIELEVETVEPLPDGYPLVGLDSPTPVSAPAVASSQMEPGLWKYTLEWTADPVGNAKAEGVWPVRAVLRDDAGNQEVHGALNESPVSVDFTPPGVLDAQLQLVPPPGAPQPAVSVATNGTGISLSLTVNEPLEQDPEVVASCPGGALTFPAPVTVSEGNSPTYHFALVPDSLPEAPDWQGEYETEATLVDRVGNQTTVALDLAVPLAVDSTPPDGLEQDSQVGVRLLRIPWGAEVTQGNSLSTLQACPGQELDEQLWTWCPVMDTPAFELGSTVVVFAATLTDAGTICSQSELARGIVDEEGRLEVAIPGDWPAVCVAEADAAGNLAEQQTPVQKVTVTATFGGENSGTTLNPCSMQGRRWFNERLVQPGDLKVGSDGALASPDGVETMLSGGGTWVDRGLQFDHELLAVVRSSMVYDTARGKLVHVGGSNYSALNQHAMVHSVMERTDLVWQELQGSDPEMDGNPPTGLMSAVAYDPLRREVVLFGGALWGGGEDHGTESDQTWLWDGESWALASPIAPEGEGNPPSLIGAAMAYSAVNGGLLMFGGERESEVKDELWLWDGSSWNEMVPLDPEGDGDPVPRKLHGLVHDSRRGRVVLFGGETDDEYLADTWEWTGSSWLRMIPEDPEADGNPPPGNGTAMAYDVDRGRTVVAAGTKDWAAGEVWEWDGTSWEFMVTEDPEGDGDPLLRESASMAWDSSRKTSVLCGGMVDGPDVSDESLYVDICWEWDGVSWRNVTFYQDGVLLAEPEPVAFHSVTYNANHKQMVLVGGTTWVSGQLSSDCREQTLSTGGDLWRWHEEAASPARRAGHGSAYDSNRNTVLVLGGSRVDCQGMGNDLWEWDGQTWTMLEPNGTSDERPPLMRSRALAYDSHREKLVLHGGLYDYMGQVASNADTWEWDGTEWEMVLGENDGPTVPPLRSGNAVVYDAERQETLVYGGYSPNGNLRSDLWSWDGAAWTLLSPTDPEADGAPPAIREANTAFDTYRRTVLLANGETAAGFLHHVWEWDGTSWSRAPETDPEGDGAPSGRLLCGSTYDSHRRRLVVVGGAGGPETYSDWWEWDGGAKVGPAFIFSVPTTLLGVRHGARVTRGETRWVTGGSGHLGDNGKQGSSLLVWSDLGWRPVGENSAPADSPSNLEWSQDRHCTLQRLLVGENRSLHVAVAPIGHNERSWAEVSVDYVEVAIDYRLPLEAEYHCADGVDDDADGKTDCLDPDCAKAADCEPSGEQTCDDGWDNDGDGLTDCSDHDCWCRDDCGLGAAGCCNGATRTWCDGPILTTEHCLDLAEPLSACGWIPLDGAYGCGGSGVDPDGDVPATCPCLPECGDAECGSDGCGGECGECPEEGDLCVLGACHCVPDCLGKDCGNDGCGGACGECTGNLTSCVGNTCLCQPDCTGVECGDDGCGNACGDCPDGQYCQLGVCVCEPQCAGQECGDDGCGGNCGECDEANESCLGGKCVCEPLCAGKECGDDGCYGSCGTCDTGEACSDSACVPYSQLDCFDGSEPSADDCVGFIAVTSCCDNADRVWYCLEGRLHCIDCAGNNPHCGFDPLGDYYDCGTDGGEDPLGFIPKSCGETCVPDCDGKQCGDDGCGGECGSCANGENCFDSTCTPFSQLPCLGSEQASVDNCDGFIGAVTCCDGIGRVWLCGNDQLYCIDCAGVNPSCGWNAESGFYDCATDGGVDPAGLVEKSCGDSCVPDCDGKQCGDDGCGGECGTCAADKKCENDQCVDDPCLGITVEGCCWNGANYFCWENQLYSVDCSANPSCGWNAGNGYYDCGTAGSADPSGTWAYSCL
jgi:hypothetical protein